MFFRECFVKSASGSVLGLGYIWILVDEKNRGWHDKILDSYVVDLKESEKMNLRRHLEKARAEAIKPEPESMPVVEPASEPVPEVKEAEQIIPEVKEAEQIIPEVKETEPVIPEVQPAEEPVIEVTPEVVGSEAEEAPKEDDVADAEVISSEEASVQTAEEIADDAAPETPELSLSMKKEELLEAARARGVKVSARATKAAIIEAIEKAEAETEE